MYKETDVFVDDTLIAKVAKLLPIALLFFYCLFIW